MRNQRHFQVHFIRNSEVKFMNPDTGKMEWYGSDYGRGTSMEVVDLISGNPQEIRVRCLDGEIGVIRTEDVRIS